MADSSTPTLTEDDHPVLCAGCSQTVAYAPSKEWMQPPDDLWCFSCWSDVVDYALGGDA